MIPSSSTTTTSQRPLTFSSRSPPATAGPRICMTRRSVTTPSAERSLHHCSLRSEKIQRAVDKLITLLKKVCCQVSRCLSVMLEQGDLFLMSLDHSFRILKKKIRAITSCWKKALSQSCASCIFSRVWKLNASPCILFPKRLGRRRYEQFHFFWRHHGQNFIVHRNSDSSFSSSAKTQLDDTKSQLLRRH